MSKLRFCVAACTSEDSAFLASELEQPADNSQGYMTAKNCPYPQELVLQLEDGLCRLTQVQLLSHQSHIATKMELFVSKSLSFEGNSTRFSRLGFLTLKPNTESRYMARELKTVHIDHEAALLKLRIHACHVNDHNLYNQVGIMDISLCGEPLELLPSHSRDEVVGTKPRHQHKNHRPQDQSFDMRFDAKTAARIREIQVAKDQAVANEDYDQAKRLKQMEEQLKSVGLQLARLEAQKREAVANEDYDLAKKIKHEISMLEASVGSNETQPILPMPPVAPSPSRSQVMPRIGAMQRSTSSFAPRDMYPEDPQVAKSGSFYGDGSGSLRHSQQGGFPGNGLDLVHATDTDQEDENSGPSAHFRGLPDAENLPDPDEIPPALAKESEELIAVIGPFFTRCFYSNLWNHRDAAIRKVTMDMGDYPVEPVRLLEVCSTLAQSGAGDRIAQVALSAFGLLDRMVVIGSRIRRDDMCRALGNSMTQLVNKLGESQAKVREEAAAVLGRLAAAKNVGVAFVTSHLTKRSKKPLGLKLLQGRLLVLKKLQAEFELLPDSDFSVSGIMGFLEDCNCLAHQSREIRDAAKDITVSLYLVVGADVEGYLKSLRPKQLEEYQAAFEAAETAKVSSRRVGAAAGGNGSVARRDEEPREEQATFESEVDDADSDEDSVDEYTCPFCGVVDDKFDSDYLDQHFWASCKMLTPCKMCGQVIEISTLNEHLLTECEMQQNHRECPRCGEAITAKFYERHVSLTDCPPRAPLNRANRCPLCHEDIAPGKRGWRRHLLEQGCSNNPRS
ncbi:UvrB/uvrC motif-containing protein [Phytophthora infestans]|uniref:UvrB/uvrC motif-containing protein n=1 Tax=Phytophthora infestans TaxID=4787 RepID=A0A833S3D9_PHYIN|nr:UvrB/uvrC motif-containing protein [Phytophthora infestans]